MKFTAWEKLLIAVSMCDLAIVIGGRQTLPLGLVIGLAFLSGVALGEALIGAILHKERDEHAALLEVIDIARRYVETHKEQ